MCKLPALLGAAVLSTSTSAFAVLSLNQLDQVYGTGGVVLDKFDQESLSDQVRDFVNIDGVYITAGYFEKQGISYGSVNAIDKAGRPKPGKRVSIHDARFYSIGQSRGRLTLFGRKSNRATVMVRDAQTLLPVPGCGDAEGLIQFQGAAGSSSNFIGSFPIDGEDRVGALILNITSQNRTLGGVMMWDVANCAPVPTFGNNGFLIADDFFPGSGAWAGDGGLVAGNFKPAGAANQTGAVLDFDALGRPGNCNGLKTIHGEAGQDVFLNSAVWDTALQRYYVGGYRSPATTPVIKRIPRSTCVADATAFNWTGTGFVNAMTIAPATVARERTLTVVMNTFSGSPYRTGLALYPLDGGDPVILPAVNGTFTTLYDPAASDPVSMRSGGKAATATVTITNSIGYAVAVDPDGKLVLAGTADPAGGSALLARYIGVEITSNVIEFYNSGLDHYFITADAAEAAAVDAGAAGPGWGRTGQTWKSGGPDRVCRFYGSPEIDPATGLRRGPNSHFYTISADECAAVKQDPGWRFESYDFSGWPKVIDGSCPAGTIAVKRAYNGRFAQNDSNHRYTTDDGVYNQMVAMGWSGEGSVFCAVL